MWNVLLRIVRSARKGLDIQHRSFTERFLDDNELVLFNQMALWDQYHTVNTAKLILEHFTGTGNGTGTGAGTGLDTASGASIGGGAETKIRLLTLIKAALLHDVGKVKGDAGLPTRLCVSFIRRVFPDYRRKHADRGGNKLQYALYVDLIHPARGAYMALSTGVCPEIADLIRRHHDEPQNSDPEELRILQEADAKS